MKFPMVSFLIAIVLIFSSVFATTDSRLLIGELTEIETEMENAQLLFPTLTKPFFSLKRL
jgi:hypothetical protein